MFVGVLGVIALLNFKRILCTFNCNWNNLIYVFSKHYIGGWHTSNVILPDRSDISLQR